LKKLLAGLLLCGLGAIGCQGTTTTSVAKPKLPSPATTPKVEEKMEGEPKTETKVETKLEEKAPPP
jgi:hypothetical protein